MLSAYWRWASVAAVATLAACTTIQNATDERAGSRYQVGETGSARVGEVMLDRYRYRSQSLAKPQAAIPPGPGRLEVRAGTSLVSRKVDGELSFCTRLDGNFACFYDSNSDGSFDQVRVVNLGIASSKQPLVPTAPYTRSDAPQSRGYKYELRYLGRSNEIIRLNYREYADDLIRPANEQDLEYTLAAEGATEINVHSARLKIIAADNDAIRYEVLAGLGE